jgi:hypothetical protein
LNWEGRGVKLMEGGREVKLMEGGRDVFINRKLCIHCKS